MLGIDIGYAPVVIGAITGAVYGLLALGLVLIHRSTRVINFAHGEIGAFGAALLAKMVIDWDWSFFVAFPVVLGVGGALGAIIELTVIRRLFDSPRIVVLVATIGISQLLFFAQVILPSPEATGRYPTGLDRVARFGELVLRGEHFLVLAFVPAAVFGLVRLVNRTPFGAAVRASAENPAAAQLAGVSTRRVSTTVWVLAGILATATVVLISPVRGTIIGAPSLALGPGLLLRALTAALIGRLSSLSLTMVGGIALGIAEAIAFSNVGSPGTVDALVFLVVMGLLFFRPVDDRATGGAWTLAGRTRAIPERLLAVPWVRRLPYLAGAVAVVIAVVLPIVFSTSERQFLFTRMLLYALAGLSVTVITGWAGHLSLGQFAFTGLGAMVVAGLTSRGMPFASSVVYATGAGAIAAIFVGIPALRVKGLFLGIITLGFAVAAQGWLLPHSIFLGKGTTTFVQRTSLGPLDLTDARTYYYVCLAVLVVAVLSVGHLRKTGAGRAIIAVRDNEESAASFTLSATVVKLSAFALSGALAALAGALLAGLRVQFSANDFPSIESLRLVAMTIIGGIGSVWGAVLGAAYLLGLPAMISDSVEVQLLTSGVGLLVVLLYLPGGILEVVHLGRDAIVRRLSASASEPPARRAGGDLPRSGRRAATSDARPLDVRGVTVAFGGIVAVDSVSMHARAGEIVGLIGTNGAGKSTLLNAIGGYVPTTGGTTEIFGTDVSQLPAHLRARLGVGRVFQDARLFTALTVRDTVAVALEARERSELVPSLLALPPSRRAERSKLRDADALVDFVGLGRYAGTFVGDLSTGTRRIVELACLLAVDARLILLDEPTAGVAQRETEAFGPLIKEIQRELAATIVVIEHDMPMIMSLSDRIYCMSAGAVIAEGPPDAIRRSPQVIAAYLGTDERAIQRSDAPLAAAVLGDG